jgi:Common central domain of tyrosinase
MAFGDGIRRNIAHVEPSERALLRDAFIELNKRVFPGKREDSPPGGVSFWFKQDEIHQATHVHGGPEFLPWHREITNRLEAMLREVNPQLSLHYWSFSEDPTNVPNGNLGGGATGPLNLFDPNFMGSSNGDAGDPWLKAKFYDPQAGTPGHPPDRDVTQNPVDPPIEMKRTKTAPGALLPIADLSQGSAFGEVGPKIPANGDNDIISAITFPDFRIRLECMHNLAHVYIAKVSPHIAFRDPLVFLLHSNVDRIFARWQTDPAHPERLDPNTVYGSESNLDVNVLGEIQNLNHNVEPWSTGVGAFHTIRPWEASHENQGSPHTYKDPSVVAPPRYDTNFLPCDLLMHKVEVLGRNLQSLQEALDNGEIPPPPITPKKIAKVQAFIRSQTVELSRQRRLLQQCLAANP